MSNSRSPGSVHYDNSGRVALITGGCGGIGRAISVAFARSECAAVIAMDRHAERPAELEQAIHYLQGDVGREEDCARAIEQTVQQFGGLDVLVNTAAIQPSESYVPADQLDSTVWNRMTAVNFSGYHFMAKHALRQMLKQESGVVINIASAQGHRTARQVAAYGPIKAANLMQARQWGVEYARRGIRVVSVSPGAIRTPLLAASLAEQGGEEELANRHPLGRLGEPAEVAAAVLWCASGDASFVTATDLEVDGGLGAFAAFADPYP